MRPCNSCPFLSGTRNIGTTEWVRDVLFGVERGSISHSCHKTDPLADGYVGHKEGKDSVCMGFLGMMKNDSNVCIDPNINEKIVNGTFDFDEVPTKPCFKTVNIFAYHHSKQFLKRRKKK